MAQYQVEQMKIHTITHLLLDIDYDPYIAHTVGQIFIINSSSFTTSPNRLTHNNT
jgi:Ser-tRNA(Ala) deacylase AlaX